MHGWFIVSGKGTYLSTGSWKSIVSMRFKRGEVPTSYGTRLISNKERGIEAMMPPNPMLEFTYVDQGEDCTGEDISIEKLLETQGAD